MALGGEGDRQTDGAEAEIDEVDLTEEANRQLRDLVRAQPLAGTGGREVTRELRAQRSEEQRPLRPLGSSYPRERENCRGADGMPRIDKRGDGAERVPLAAQER